MDEIKEHPRFLSLQKIKGASVIPSYYHRPFMFFDGVSAEWVWGDMEKIEMPHDLAITEGVQGNGSRIYRGYTVSAVKSTFTLRLNPRSKQPIAPM